MLNKHLWKNLHSMVICMIHIEARSKVSSYVFISRRLRSEHHSLFYNRVSIIIKNANVNNGNKLITW